MPLLQKPASTPEELEASKPLGLTVAEVEALTEAEWYERAFRGDAAQLTVRAVAMGMGLGFLLAFTNVYVGLKAGWGLGVALTACIVSFSVWSTLVRLKLARSPMSILENNCMQSSASAAGYATSTLLVNAVPAMLMLSVTPDNPRGTQLRWYLVGAWVFCVAALGVLMAIPMKRSMVNRERLRFPSGTAAAVLLQSLYSEGAEALAKGRALFVSGCLGTLVPLLTALNVVHGAGPDGPGRTSLLPSESKIFDGLPGVTVNHLDPKTHALVRETFPLSASHVVLDHSLVLVAAGAIVGLRATLSMVAGGLLIVFLIGPAALDWTWTNPLGDLVAAATRPGAAWKEIGIWYGAPLMVSHGLVTFGLQYETLARALNVFRKTGRSSHDSVGDAIEAPIAWFLIGTAIAGTAVVVLARIAFDIPVHYSALAVFLTFFLALVACRATGETDITPVSAMGKIMQLTYGVLMPQSYTANLMTASITASASAEAADLLNDLKSGYLLGAHPRRQFVAQFLGIFTGTVASVLAYFILVPDATVLTGTAGRPPQFAAPSAQQWKAVAEVFRLGIHNLHPMAQQAIAVGLLAGAVLAITERVFPKERRWLPSAAGLGLGLLLPFSTSLSFALGAIAAWAYGRARPQAAERYVVPVSSGVIAGESIVGVVVAALNNFVLK
jgi:OPT family oligopeptide transporter